MGTQSPLQRGGALEFPESEPPEGDRGGDPFRRRFLEFQLVFVVFMLIASIPEAPSPHSRLSASVQVVIIAVLWFLSDATALVVHARHLLRQRSSG